MAKYLVTGCAGFIGSHVTERLLSQSHQVVGVDSINDAYDVRLKEWRLGKLTDWEDFSFHRLDICDRESLRQVFAPDLAGVLNLAARAGVFQSVKDPWVYYEANVTGTLNLLDLCREFQVPKFLLASTSSIYGGSTDSPFREDSDTSRPLSPYAASKKAAEALCYTYHYLHGIDISIPRYFTVYGPAGRPEMSLFRFVQWIAEGRPVMVYGDGKQSRDFTYVEDIVRGTIAALKPLGYEIINLGSDRPEVLLDAINIIEGEVGARAKLQHVERHSADILATHADISKARQMLGWEPEVEFRQGIKQLVAWYFDNRDWAKDIHTV